MINNGQQLHVLIIGAGVSGLLTAHGLQQAGIKYSIFETEEQDQWRSKEWGMAMHWSLPLLEKLLPSHLAARIFTDTSVDPSLDYSEPPNNGAYIVDGLTGEVLKDLTTQNERIVRVSRRKLRMLCQEGVEVHWNHTLASIATNSSTVSATFENGKTYSGSLLIGADGPHSSVRKQIFAGNPELGEAQAWDGVLCPAMGVSYNGELARQIRAVHPVSFIALSPAMMFFLGIQDTVNPDQPETWKFWLAPCWYGKRDTTLSHIERVLDFKKRAENLAEPFRSAILSVPDDIEVSYSPLTYWVSRQWDSKNGLVTLVGDAAHPMPPFRGQGINHAVLDVHNLVKVMTQVAASPEDQIQEIQASLVQGFSDEVAKRGAEETRLSIKSGEGCLDYDQFKESPYAKQGLAKGQSE